jgi:hypothetical protein
LPAHAGTLDLATYRELTEGNMTVYQQRSAEWSLEDGQVELPDAVDEVLVRVPSGSVTVAVVDGPPRVLVEGAEGGPVLLAHAGGRLTIRQAGPEGSEAVDDLVGSLLGAAGLRPGVRRRAEVTVLLPVPARAGVRTVGAEVMFSGVRAASAETVSGSVTVSRVPGSTRILTVSGAIQAAGVDGVMDVSTATGDVTIAGGRLGGFRVRTVSGDVAVDADLLAGDHGFRSMSGNLALRIATPDGLDLDASTFSGSLVCSVGQLDDLSRPGLRRVRARDGNGGARFRSTSVSGDLTVMARPAAGAA